MLDRRRAELYLSSAVGKFDPWIHDGRSPQRELCRSVGRFPDIIYRAGNRTGKTTGGAWVVAQVLQSLHPFLPPKPVRGWVSALDREWGIGEVIWPALKPFIDDRLVRSYGWYRRRDPEIPSQITFKNGSSLVFKSAASGRKKYQGGALDFVWMDEEHPPDIYEEVQARLVDRNGWCLQTLTPLQRYRYMQDLERSDDVKVIRASMLDAAHAGIIPLHAVKRLVRTWSERTVDVRVYGKYAAYEGAVYPDFDRQVHCLDPVGGQLLNRDGELMAPWPLPESWPRRAAIDFGFANPTAVPIAALEPTTGRVFVYRCPYAPFIRASRWGKWLGDELPDLQVPLVADHDRNEREELKAAGIPTRPAEKEIVPGLEAVERYLRPDPDSGRPSLYFVIDSDIYHPMVGRMDAEKVCWEMEGYRYPEQKEGAVRDVRDVPIKKDDHAMDALRYLIMDIEKVRGATWHYGMLDAKGTPGRSSRFDDMRPS